LNWNSY